MLFGFLNFLGKGLTPIHNGNFDLVQRHQVKISPPMMGEAVDMAEA
nr:hypothetical protein [uncultured Undibacterium sp.]